MQKNIGTLDLDLLVSSVVGKKYSPNGGFMVIYHGRYHQFLPSTKSYPTKSPGNKSLNFSGFL